MFVRRLVFLVAVVMMLQAAAGAQSLHNSDAYLGYSRLGSDAFYSNVGGLNGWNAAVHIHLRPFLGAEGEVAQYGLGADPSVPRTTTFMAGPRVTVKALGVGVFAHGLVGGEHSASNGATVSISETTLAYAFGAGVDLPLLPFFAWRVGADRIAASTVSPSDGQKYRFNTGLVLRF
jgi:hypothetical protein